MEQLTLMYSHPPEYVRREIRAELDGVSEVLGQLEEANELINSAIDDIYGMSWDLIDRDTQQKLCNESGDIQDTIDRLQCLIARVKAAA